MGVFRQRGGPAAAGAVRPCRVRSSESGTGSDWTRAWMGGDATGAAVSWEAREPVVFRETGIGDLSRVTRHRNVELRVEHAHEIESVRGGGLIGLFTC